MDDGGDVTHWTVAGPAGVSVEWDAKVIDDEPGRKMAWKSIERDGQKSNTVPNGGARGDQPRPLTGVADRIVRRAATTLSAAHDFDRWSARRDPPP